MEEDIFYGFHATDHNIKEFNLDWVQFGEGNFGPGVYFSTKATNIDFYLNENPDGNIYKTAILKSTMINWYDLVDNDKIRQFIEDSYLESEVSYFLEKYLNKNYLYLFTNMPYEESSLRKDKDESNLKRFLNLFTSHTNIDSMFMQNGTFRDEIVVFNPSSIRIVSNLRE